MDSTVMWIVHQATKKMQSKEGVLQRLNGICRFCELAVMQLEGCLKFVRPEIGSYALESNYEQLLENLSEIQTRLQGQLKESQLAIKAKNLELASLRESSTNVKLERITRSEPVEEYILDNTLSGDDDEDDGC